MSPATIALVFQILNLIITEAPEMVNLVKTFEVDFGKHTATQQTLKQITDGTIEVSNETLALLAPLLKGQTQ
jgi:hypothetical protein